MKLWLRNRDDALVLAVLVRCEEDTVQVYVYDETWRWADITDYMPEA